MKYKKKYLAQLMTILILFGYLPCWSQQLNEQQKEISTKIYNKIQPVLARITCEKGNKVGSGSVIGITKSGVTFILTACHVVTKNYDDVFKKYPNLKPQFYNDIFISFGEESKLTKGLVLTDSILIKYFKVEKRRETSDARFFTDEYYDIRNDLVLLISYKPDNKEIVRYNKSETVKPGQIVAAIGFPKGDKPNVTLGNIKRSGANHFFTNAEIISGNSGGPLIDKYGRMIGMVTQLKNNEGQATKISIILPIVQNWLDELKSYGIIQKEWQRQKYAKFIQRFYRDPKFITGELIAIGTLSYIILNPPEPDLPGPPGFPQNSK